MHVERLQDIACSTGSVLGFQNQSVDTTPSRPVFEGRRLCPKLYAQSSNFCSSETCHLKPCKHVCFTHGLELG